MEIHTTILVGVGVTEGQILELTNTKMHTQMHTQTQHFVFR